MFKAILHEKQILIVLLGSILIFIGYNVLTAEATETEDKKKSVDWEYDYADSAEADRDRVEMDKSYSYQGENEVTEADEQIEEKSDDSGFHRTRD